MSYEMENKKQTIQEGKDFTLTQLTNFLNEKFGKKKSGVPFTVSDVQGYIRRGYLPPYLGGNEIMPLDLRFAGVKVYRLLGE